MSLIEFWPDYGQGPLWSPDGTPVDPASLGLPDDLVQQLSLWNGSYDDDKLPIEGAGDPAWLAEGRLLLQHVRAAVGPAVRVVVTEPWWGEAGYRAVSLNAHLGTTDEACKAAIEDSLAAPDIAEAISDRLTLRRLLDALTAQERLILEWRFADDDSQSTIARRLGVSQMQVSRILSRLLTCLRNSWFQADQAVPASVGP